MLPGCTTPGYIKYECAVCHDTVQSTLPATGHHYDTDKPDWIWAEDLTGAVVRFH